MDRARFSGMLLLLGTALAPWLAAGGEERAATVESVALVVPSRAVELSAPLASTIRRVLVAESDRVAEGQALVELDSEMQQIAVTLSEARLKAAAARLGANRTILALKEEARAVAAKLYQLGKQTQAEVAQATFEAESAKGQFAIAEAELEIQKLELQRSRLSLKQMTLLAPFAGVVGGIHRAAGEFLPEGQPAVQLLDIDRLHVVTYVPFPAALRVRPGMAAELKLPHQADAAPYRCRVLRMTPKADTDAGSLRVTLELENREQKILAGSGGSVVIHLADEAPR